VREEYQQASHDEEHEHRFDDRPTVNCVESWADRLGVEKRHHRAAHYTDAEELMVATVREKVQATSTFALRRYGGWPS
jgi:hypothetical protein